MVATIAAGTSAQYYIETTDYYLGGREPAGRWIAVAPGLPLAIGAVVERTDFEQIHAGLRPDGSVLLSTVGVGGPRRRIGGYDATFSAPKSVALLWAIADDEFRASLEAAQSKVVAQAIGLAEDYAAFCRFGRGGIRREKTFLTVAAFQHGDSRPAEHADGQTFSDPNLHTHCVVINAGPRRDRSGENRQDADSGAADFGALDGTALFAAKMCLGAQYHASLSFELMRLGLSVEATGKNGLFEVRGVPVDLIKYFSARRKEIEDELAASGMASSDSPALAASIARKSRKAKQEHEVEDRHADWRARVAEQGHDAAAVIEASLAECEQREHLEDRLARIPLELTEHESTFDRRALHGAVASAFVGTGEDPSRAASEVDRLIAAGRFVVLDHDSFGQEILTTPEMLRLEREIGEMAQALSAINAEPINTERVDGLIAGHELNAEQAAAVRQALASRAVNLIEGAPGCGKTTLLKPVVQALQEAGCRVIAGATAWKGAHALRDELSIEARAVDSWLAVAEHGGNFVDENTVLVIDEAGLLSSRQMHALLKAVSGEHFFAGNGRRRLLLLGDRNQLQSVGAGSGLRLVANALSVTRVDRIIRQNEQWARDAVTDFGKGRAKEALGAYRDHGMIHEVNGTGANVRTLVDACNRARTESSNASVLMVTKTNAQVRAISTEVRRRMREQGEIVGPDQTISAVSASGHAVALPVAQGDRIRFLKRATLDGTEVINGAEGRVEAIRVGETVELTVTTQDGRIRFSPDQIADEHGRARIDHAYASTIHGAQGMTVERAFVWLTPGMDRHDIYVAASRARAETRFFLDRQGLDASLKASLPLDQRRQEETIQFEERLDFLATQLSRARLKRTTQDFQPVPDQQPSLSASQERQSQGRGRNQVAEIGLD
ncbi:MobF family relaxase [Devosia sp. ZB163]|uniref:MobF family relaxase n=1 Tax=Devosia sp. ZB163 TaxID=3025938 RepID=UPI00235F86D3|nr:MobF family relaxase [Devosia sp. ZB163]MDC9823276.1 MobF family relaxase [Devosia sp. ZB163]